MFQLSVCADTVLLELPFEARVSEIAAAGFGVDFWRWRDHDMDRLAERLAADPQVRISSFAGYVGGSIVHPDGVDEFLRGVEESLLVAQRLDCRHLTISTGGFGMPGVVAHAAAENPILRWATAYKGLARVAELAERHDVYYNLEHLNTKRDHARYPLATVDDALALLEAVGSPRIGLLLDLYHLQVQEGNLCDTIRRCGDRIGYVHVADVPGRHEPGTGEINFEAVVDALLETGYDGHVGLEAFPAGSAADAMESFGRVFGGSTTHPPTGVVGA